jgi:hypothetical protein
MGKMGIFLFLLGIERDTPFLPKMGASPFLHGREEIFLFTCETVDISFLPKEWGYSFLPRE